VIQPRRLLAGAAVAVACTLVASACDSSPVAVTVNSKQIKQTSLNASLREYAGNPDFVKAYESQGEGQSTIQGESSGTYSATFVAGVLNSVITSTALHQYLAAHHNLPSASQVAAARAWQSAIQSPYWLGFSSSFRDQMAENFADESQFVETTINQSEVRRATSAASGFLFTLVCVRQVGFTATGANGQPDFPAALAEARDATRGRTALQGGAVTCYSPPRLEDQGNPFYTSVIDARVGRPVAPQRTRFGYQVLEVTDRNHLPINEGMRKVTSLVAAQETGGKVPALQAHVISSARVWLNPQYGTWDPEKGVTPASPKVNGSAT
jgi:hypothetical protein